MTANSEAQSRALWRRVARFARKPYREKRITIGVWWTQVFPHTPLPIRLEDGRWWLLRNDVCGQEVLLGRFEQAEFGFVQSYLRPGMTVLDIGAHHGFYTLLASRKVGPAGRVIAFEPSPRERKLLGWNLRINRCRNVTVEPYALAAADGTATLFQVAGRETGCNSLRKPNVGEAMVELTTGTRCLQGVLREKAINRVDFVKLDAEGAELEILKGASRLLTDPPRPVMLVEVQGIRTRPWGYEAAEIIAFLEERDYVWFRPLPNSRLERVDSGQRALEGNFVAVPRERSGVLMRRCRFWAGSSQ